MSLPGGEDSFGRKASYNPHETGALPVQLRFDQFDTAVRDASITRRVAPPERFSREWWTKSKMIFAAMVLALLLMLIIVLPIVLTVGRSSSTDSTPSNASALSRNNDTLFFPSFSPPFSTTNGSVLLQRQNDNDTTSSSTTRITSPSTKRSTTRSSTTRFTTTPSSTSRSTSTPSTTSSTSTTTTTSTSSTSSSTTASSTTTRPTLPTATTAAPGSCRTSSRLRTKRCADGRDYPERWACSGLLVQCEGVCGECDPELAFACLDDRTRCIPQLQMCDHHPDCLDGSDEAADLCACKNDGTSFKCASPSVTDGRPKCIPMIFRCDGYRHCENGEDEQDCSSCYNNPLAFFCVKSKTCFPSASRCDGVIDCADYTDEEQCTCDLCKSQIYETFMCREKRRCLKQELMCSATFSQYRCPGASAAEERSFCSSRSASPSDLR